MKRQRGERQTVMVFEASVVVGYLIAWAVRKAKSVGRRLDTEADAVIDAGLVRLHEAVAARLGAHPALDDLAEEAERAASGAAAVSELTRQQIELAVTAAVRKDEAFGLNLAHVVAELRMAERRAGTSVTATGNSRVFAGDAHAAARDQGIAVGQLAGDLNVGDQQRPDPRQPGR
jgi:hypothetical protein